MKNEKATDEKAEIKGARNLALLAVGSVLIATITTVMGVYIYVSSGDIYLDRSLPGLLPDAAEHEEDNSGLSEQYVFNDYGPVNSEVLDDFLENFDEIRGEAAGFGESFSDAPLSDEALIPTITEE